MKCFLKGVYYDHVLKCIIVLQGQEAPNGAKIYYIESAAGYSDFLFPAILLTENYELYNRVGSRSSPLSPHTTRHTLAADCFPCQSTRAYLHLK